MATKENKALVQRWIDEVVNGGNMDLVDGFLDPDYTGIGGTREGYRKDTWRDILPDMHHTVEGIAADGDAVWVRYTVRGTHTGSGPLGLQSTGREIEFSNVCIYTIRDGKILSSWGLVDRFSFLEQLGVAPPLAELFEQARARQS